MARCREVEAKPSSKCSGPSHSAILAINACGTVPNVGRPDDDDDKADEEDDECSCDDDDDDDDARPR